MDDAELEIAEGAQEQSISSTFVDMSQAFGSINSTFSYKPPESRTLRQLGIEGKVSSWGLWTGITPKFPKQSHEDPTSTITVHNCEPWKVFERSLCWCWERDITHEEAVAGNWSPHTLPVHCHRFCCFSALQCRHVQATCRNCCQEWSEEFLVWPPEIHL